MSGARLAGLPEGVLQVRAAAFGLGDGTGERRHTLATLVAAVAGAAHVRVCGGGEVL